MGSAVQTAAPARPRSRARRLLTTAAIAVVTIVLALYLGISALAAVVLTTPQRAFAPPQTPAAFSLAFQDVRFPARGGDVSIAGWYIPHPASRRAIVLVHGKDGNRYSEFQGHFVDFAAALRKRGFAVLMIDMRGHGQSGDAHFSFGLNERRDIEGAADWLKAQGFRPGSIGVLGVSMGSASSIGAAADDPDIGALVEDCSYAAVYPIIEREWGAASHLPDAFLPSTVAIGRVLFGADLTADRPVDEIGRVAPRPVLIIHGSGDQLIPVSDARALKAAAPSAELWEVAGAGHAGSYAANPAAYTERVATFFEQSLR